MTAPMLPMRPYQIEAVAAIEAAHGRGVRLPAVILPTGTGKTVVMAHLVKRRGERYTPISFGRRVLAIGHRTEIVEQIYDKIRDVAPHLRVGIVQADRNETGGDVVVASVQTLQSELRRRMIADVGLVIVDEAHHAVAQSYLKILAHYGAWGPGDPVGQQARAVAVGFTATMVRADDKSLGDVWQEIVYARAITEMIDAGYLVRPQGLRVEVDDLDLSQVKVNRGDFAEGALGRAITDSMAPQAIAKAITTHSPNEPGLIFAPTVASAKVIEEAVAATGMSTGFVSGATPAGERRTLWKRFLHGDVQWISNCGVATEGTDLPRAVTAVIARPTKSKGLYIQMAGRVLRPSPGKTRALLLDVVGATVMHSLQSPLSLFGEQAAVIKEKVDRDDQDLIESDDAGEVVTAEKALGIPEIDGRDGPLVATEVDLFQESAAAWKRTQGGIWFLPAGDRYIALIPAQTPGQWDVTAMDRKKIGTGRWIVTGVHEISYAMAWAESSVTNDEKTTALRARAWRKQVPSDAQKALAHRLGFIVPPEATKGEVSSWIDGVLASQRIDPYIPAYARGR